MTTYVFHHFVEHLALGHVDLSSADITVAIINSSTPIAGIEVGANAYSVPTADYCSDWTSYINTTDVEVSNVTLALSGGIYTIAVDNLTFSPSGSDYTGYGLLFYVDTGTPSTSEVVAVDIWATSVPMVAGTDYDWAAPTYLTRMVVNAA